MKYARFEHLSAGIDTEHYKDLKIRSRSQQATAFKRLNCIDVDFSLTGDSYPSLSQALHVHSLEEEIAFGNACITFDRFILNLSAP